MRGKNRLSERLLNLPWWMSLCLAALVFACATYVLPALMGTGKVLPAVANELSSLGWMFSIPFLAAAAASAVRQWMESRLLDQQASLDSIRALTWQDFEALVAEAFRRQGYSVTKRGGAAPDGGIDLVLLEKAGGKAIVQCKRWRAQQVGVEPVRELYGVMTAERANEAILVTCGEYTGAAHEFAVGQPIRLINGEALLAIVREVQPAVAAAGSGGGQPGEAVAGASAGGAVPDCPVCGSAMVRRVARRGVNEGREFWGCSVYPKCQGTRESQAVE